MRYYLSGDTLVIRGVFHSCSTGPGGGIRKVTTLLNHSISDLSSFPSPETAIEYRARSLGLSPARCFGLLTAVPMDRVCIIRYDCLTVFITAGVTHPDPGIGIRRSGAGLPGTINIICVIARGMADQALLDAIITVTEAKALALIGCGYEFAGTVTDAVIIAAEGGGEFRYAGGATSLGRRIHEAVLFGVPRALENWQGESSPTDKKPSFFIHSTIGGERWIEWHQGGCPYYPCHFKGQRCEFCYCPLYPCEDETLGEWTTGSQKKGRVWSCAPCTLNHQPAVVRHLKKNPEAGLQELKAVLASSGNGPTQYV